MNFFAIAIGALVSANVLAAGALPVGEIPMPADARKLRPGLWEVTRQSESSVPQIDASSLDLSGLDAAARARVEAVLKKQAAERAARGGAPQVTSRTKQECLTQEAIDQRQKSFNPDGERDRRCPPLVKTASASHLVVEGNCTVEGQKFNFQMEFEVISPEETLTKMTSNGTYGGRPVGSSDTVRSRWIGPGCGSVKAAK